MQQEGTEFILHFPHRLARCSKTTNAKKRYQLRQAIKKFISHSTSHLGVKRSTAEDYWIIPVWTDGHIENYPYKTHYLQMLAKEVRQERVEEVHLIHKEDDVERLHDELHQRRRQRQSGDGVEDGGHSMRKAMDFSINYGYAMDTVRNVTSAHDLMDPIEERLEKTRGIEKELYDHFLICNKKGFGWLFRPAVSQAFHNVVRDAKEDLLERDKAGRYKLFLFRTEKKARDFVKTRSSTGTDSPQNEDEPMTRDLYVDVETTRQEQEQPEPEDIIRIWAQGAMDVLELQHLEAQGIGTVTEANLGGPEGNETGVCLEIRPPDED